MIFCSFCCCSFLIVSTLANPNVIKLSQPKSKSDTKSKQTVVVSIDVNQQYFVGTTKVSLAELKAKLQPFLAKETDQPSIVINADKTVRSMMWWPLCA